MQYHYLDYAATTPVDERVAAIMSEYLTASGQFGNPASLHHFGVAAKQAIEIARAQTAALINAYPEEIIFTSGATEAINLALKGAAKLYQRKGKHIITVKTEHRAVLDSCQWLEKEGYQVTYLEPSANGHITLQQLQQAVRADTCLVAVMFVNNETGLIQAIPTFAEYCRERDILFFVDAVQAVGKVQVDVKTLPIDFLTFSAHKIYGPKGIGALYLCKRPRRRVEPLMHGGGQEMGMRSGTLPTHQIVGLGAACEVLRQEWQFDLARIQTFRDQLVKGLLELPGVELNTDIAHAVPPILNVRFPGMLAEAILAAMPQIAASSGSACLGKGTEGSHVLRAMGQTAEQAKSALRFSLGRFTTQADIDAVLLALKQLFANSV